MDQAHLIANPDSIWSVAEDLQGDVYGRGQYRMRLWRGILTGKLDVRTGAGVISTDHPPETSIPETGDAGLAEPVGVE